MTTTDREQTSTLMRTAILEHDQVLQSTAPRLGMLSMGEGEWEWPEEKPITSTYYNTAVCGVPPPPKILATETVDEDDVSKRITMVRNYSWSDDTNYIRIYVPIPGVSSEGVAVYIEEDSIKVHAMTPEHGQFTMALNRLYDKVDVSKVCAARALLHSQTRVSRSVCRRLRVPTVNLQSSRAQGEGHHRAGQSPTARLRRRFVRQLQAVVQAASWNHGQYRRGEAIRRCAAAARREDERGVDAQNAHDANDE